MSRYAILCDEEDIRLHTAIMRFNVRTNDSIQRDFEEGANLNLITDLNDEIVMHDVLKALMKLPANTFLPDIETAMIDITPNAQQLGSTISLCGIRWADDDGTCRHVMDRIGNETFDVISFLRHVGLWAYSGEGSLLNKKLSKTNPSRSNKPKRSKTRGQQS